METKREKIHSKQTRKALKTGFVRDFTTNPIAVLRRSWKHYFHPVTFSLIRNFYEIQTSFKQLVLQFVSNRNKMIEITQTSVKTGFITHYHGYAFSFLRKAATWSVIRIFGEIQTAFE